MMYPVPACWRRWIAAGLSCLVLVGGCARLGGESLPQDRIAYSRALSTSWKQEALLNIVRLRYLDPPVFLNITSLVNGYTRRHEAHTSLNPYDIPATLGLGGDFALEERPTISYAAPSSAAFSAMLTPIAPLIPLTLIESGWDAALVLRMTVRAINGVRNDQSQDASRPGDFDRVLELVETIQRADALHMELRPGKKKGEFTQVMFLPRENPRPEIAAAINELRQLLHLHPGVREYKVVRSGSSQRDDKTLVLQTRSVLHMLTEFASCIQVPAADRKSGAVFPVPANADCSLITIHSGPRPPQRTYVQVNHEGTWFWIDRDDFDSKLHFAYLLMILRASALNEQSGAPVLTIPTN